MLRGAFSRTVAALAAALVLTACSGDGSSGTSTGTGSPTGDAATHVTSGGTSDGTSPTSGGDTTPVSGPRPYLPVPAGVELTDPGSELSLGEQGTIAWRPRKGEVAVLDVKVRTFVEADISTLQQWQLDAAGRTSSLYYVTMTVANGGDQDLSGQRIPLYVLDSADALVESSTFTTEFEPCPSQALPRGFVTGEKTTVCQAYLVPKHGDLVAVSFRPTREFNPITWVGRVTEPKQPKKSASAG